MPTAAPTICARRRESVWSGRPAGATSSADRAFGAWTTCASTMVRATTTSTAPRDAAAYTTRPEIPSGCASISTPVRQFVTRDFSVRTISRAFPSVRAAVTKTAKAIHAACSARVATTPAKTTLRAASAFAASAGRVCLRSARGTPTAWRVKIVWMAPARGPRAAKAPNPAVLVGSAWTGPACARTALRSKIARAVSAVAKGRVHRAMHHLDGRPTTPGSDRLRVCTPRGERKPRRVPAPRRPPRTAHRLTTTGASTTLVVKCVVLA